MADLLLFFTVCFLAFSNGANDNFKGVASLYGCGAASYRAALTWATITTLAGSVCALFLANGLLIKFSGKGLASDNLIQSIPFITAVAAGAGLTVILATRLGFPVSTTHALIGALTGSTLWATGSVKLEALGNNFILPLLLSPVLSMLLAMLIYTVFRGIKRQKAIADLLCVCAEPQLTITSANFADQAGAIALPLSSGHSLSVDNPEACEKRNAGIIREFSLKRQLDNLHFISAGAVCFARGLNDAPKITALLLLAPGFSLQAKIALIAFIMAIGGITNARRVAETMSHKITAISPGQGLSANLTTAFLVILASKLGLPVSTTHVSVGALFGIGVTNKTANAGMIASILLSWVLTLPCAVLCAAGIFAILNAPVMQAL